VIGCTDDVLTFWQVFEELVRAQDNKTIWNKLLIYTNQVQDLMLLVFVDCTNDEVKCVHDEVKRFFTCGEGKNCHVTSIHTRVMNKYVQPLLSVVPCLGIKGNPGYHRKYSCSHVSGASSLNDRVVLHSSCFIIHNCPVVPFLMLCNLNNQYSIVK
jgi:hypothetical protein